MEVSVWKKRWYQLWPRVRLIVLITLLFLLLVAGIAATVRPSALEWEVARPFIPLPEGPRGVSDISVGPDGTIYVVSGGHILRQEPGSEDWDILSASIPHYVSTVLVDQLHDQLLAGTIDGVFRSSDGLAWERLGEDLEDSPVKVLMLDQGGTLYASSYHYTTAYPRLGVFRLMKDGKWVRTSEGLGEYPAVTAMAVGPEGILYAVNEYLPGIFCSVDGNLWQPVIGGLPDVPFYDLLVISEGAIYASSLKAGVYRSDDGKTWQATNDGLGSLRVTGLVQGEGDVLYLHTWDAGVFRSDNGVTWRPINQGLTGLCVWTLSAGLNGDLFAGIEGEGLFRSSNGETWQAVTGWPNELDVDGLQVAQGGKLYASTSTGVFLLADEGRWESINEGLPDVYTPRLAASETGALYSSSDGNVFRLSDEMVWQKAVPDRVGPISSLLVVSSTDAIYVAMGPYGVSRSIGGEEWHRVNEGVGRYPEYLVSTGEGILYLGGANAMYRFEHDEAWHQVASFFGNIGGLVVTEGGMHYAAISRYIFGGGEGVIRSADGYVWESVSEGLIDLDVRALAVGRDDVVYAGTAASGIFRSVDGKTWESVNDGLTSHSIRDLATGEDSTIYAATRGGGVFRLEDGLTWEPMNDGLRHSRAYLLTGDEKGNLYVTRYDGKVFYSSDLDNWEAVAPEVALPQKVDYTRDGSDLLGWRAEEPPEEVATSCDGVFQWTALDGRLWLSKDGRAWLPAVSFLDEVLNPLSTPMATGVPQVIYSRDGHLEVWALAESGALPHDEVKLPLVWRLPAGYLTLIARVWDATWYVAGDPKPAILVVGLLVAFAFALANEARRAGRASPPSVPPATQGGSREVGS